jgi:hypothetical protein
MVERNDELKECKPVLFWIKKKNQFINYFLRTSLSKKNGMWCTKGRVYFNNRTSSESKHMLTANTNPIIKTNAYLKTEKKMGQEPSQKYAKQECIVLNFEIIHFHFPFALIHSGSADNNSIVFNSSKPCKLLVTYDSISSPVPRTYNIRCASGLISSSR